MKFNNACVCVFRMIQENWAVESMRRDTQRTDWATFDSKPAVCATEYTHTHTHTHTHTANRYTHKRTKNPQPKKTKKSGKSRQIFQGRGCGGHGRSNGSGVSKWVIMNGWVGVEAIKKEEKKKNIHTTEDLRHSVCYWETCVCLCVYVRHTSEWSNDRKWPGPKMFGERW